MRHLDIISPEMEKQLYQQWLQSLLSDPEFITALVIIAAGFVILLCVLVLAAVKLVKRIQRQGNDPEADGSIHILPFLSSILASMMFGFGAIFIFLYFFCHGIVPMGTFRDIGAICYILVMCGFFILALIFSPKASKAFKTWNTACLVASPLLAYLYLSFRLLIMMMRRY